MKQRLPLKLAVLGLAWLLAGLLRADPLPVGSGRIECPNGG